MSKSNLRVNARKSTGSPALAAFEEQYELLPGSDAIEKARCLNIQSRLLDCELPASSWKNQDFTTTMLRGQINSGEVPAVKRQEN
jgi:hypothetical protein